jgi:hypothetical protein
MHKVRTAFLLGASLLTLMDAGMARALVCTNRVATTNAVRAPETGEGCQPVVAAGQPCPKNTQITGGTCSSDSGLPLLDSEISIAPNGQAYWRCTYQIPTVDNACEAVDLTLTAGSICCK